MEKILEKVIALILVIILVSANMLILGEYTIAYALSDEELSEQDAKTNQKNVEFNAYFDGETHNKTFEIGDEGAKIYVNVKVNNAGYLENGTIEFLNTNFKLKDGITNENIQSVDVNTNKIVLNKLNNGSDVTIELPIEILKNDNVTLDYFNKETSTKFTGKYVDGNGKEKDVQKEIVNKLSWKGNAEIEITVNPEKFVPFATNGNYGAMVQVRVNSKIKDNSIPIKSTNIEITVPTINNIKPTSVNVISTRTTATNGKTDGLDFINSNYSYDIENGKVVINTSNLQDSISWIKNSDDEYLVTYLFEGQEIYNLAKASGIDSQILAKANITVYNNEEKIVSKDATCQIKFTETKGTLTDFDLNVPNQMSKGYIYANYDAKEKVETEYYTTYIATVNSSKLTTSIEIIQSYDKFLTAENAEGSSTVNGKNYTYNKRVEVNQAEFNKILGQDGTITVKNENGEVLGTINKETKIDNGVYILDISDKNNNKLDIVTSAPITEGQLKIKVVKAISGNLEYSKEQMKEFTKMKMDFTGKTNTTTYTAWKENLLKEPETKVELEVNKKDLTTVVKNENVEIRAVLDTSSEYNALFENPTLKITLPSYIEKIDLKSTNILLSNGLKIKSSQIKEENGHKVIYVNIEGKQSEYTIDAEYKGAIVVLNTDITLDTLTPSGENKITLEYTNENDVATKTNGSVEQIINYVAPTGVVAANKISNYKDNMPQVESISGETKTVEIDTYSSKRTITINGTVVNNYPNDISNIVILGRIPASGNKKIDTNEELGSNFTTPLSTAVGLSGVDNSNYTVYYSDNENATRDLQDSNNGWSTTAKTSSKSYLIVFSDSYKMGKGSKIDFAYNAEIPEKLEPSQSAFTMYKVYYNNNSEIGNIDENKVSSIIGVNTKEGPKLEVNISSTAETVREGQYIRMDVEVKNVGQADVSGVKLTAERPEYVTFLNYGIGNGFYELNEDEHVIDVGDIAISETKNVSYYIKIDDDTTIIDPSLEDSMSHDEYNEYLQNKKKFPKEIINIVYVSSDEFTEKVKSNEYKMQVQDGKISINTFSYMASDEVLKVGDTIRYGINIKNISKSGDISNCLVKIQLPNGLKFESAEVKDNWTDDGGISDIAVYDEENNIVTINIGTLNIKKTIEIRAKIDKLEGAFSIMPTITADNTEEHYSNIIEHKSEKAKLQISELTISPRYISENENVTYKFSIKNNGESVARGIKIVDQLPEGLEFVEAKYVYAEKEQKITTLKDGKVQFTVNVLEPGQSIEVSIVAKAELLPDKNDKEVFNKVSVSAMSFDEVQTNEVSCIIEYDEDIHNGSGGGTTTKNHKISGTAWIDDNMNGRRDTEEQRLGNIQVVLLDKNAGSIVKDPDSNEQKITTTTQTGTYQFTNIPNGEYLVVFLYDSSNYSLTEYKKDGVDEGFNSDVIDVNITLEGKRRIAAITDTIVVNGGNVRDIDIGVYTANKFDLSLDKTVSKITLTTPTIGTKTYEYNNQVGKVEVLGQNLGKSNAVIEYKISIKNEGSVAGYVNKIVDYLPEEVSFDTELNPDWYLSDNGNIYNSSLSNEVIKPGETKEVTLIVSLKITEDKIGSIYNDAEIYESYNEQGLKDIDSTVGNKADSEDDMSQAIVVVSLVTGKIIMYTSIAVVVIALVGFGVFEIKKHVLKGKKNK